MHADGQILDPVYPAGWSCSPEYDIFEIVQIGPLITAIKRVTVSFVKHSQNPLSTPHLCKTTSTRKINPSA